MGGERCGGEGGGRTSDSRRSQKYGSGMRLGLVTPLVEAETSPQERAALTASPLPRVRCTVSLLETKALTTLSNPSPTNNGRQQATSIRQRERLNVGIAPSSRRRPCGSLQHGPLCRQTLVRQQQPATRRPAFSVSTLRAPD